ncbi:CbtA family protein [Nocardioides panzhihuensis]|uniref:Putative cobalt transporter CbtA n=1 Tax=Nocardioides panzhihuensis TaxID=860243 RepID=A0A7Z0DJZ6_9ACTN|nr:CbtA family protein [Nocardioides panzhihuensis]NYI76722.1 putative cobalt transporter CbtA [Nocardioides panzhihuensis]
MTSTPATLGRTVGHGALAGAVAGCAGAAVMYFLVEPSIRTAIAIEDAASKAAESSGHSHTHAPGHTHVSSELVTRGEQVVYGMLTAVVVGTFIGVAFALVHRYFGRRIAGRGLPGSALILAALGFLTLTLAPAIVIPANPPAVGDPATVNLRTLTYVGTIVCAVAFTGMVIAASRATSLSTRNRTLAASAVAVAGVMVLLFGIPNRPDAIPADVPAGLIWSFRLGSIAQLASMWLVMGAVYGWLATGSRKSKADTTAHDRAGAPAGPLSSV